MSSFDKNKFEGYQTFRDAASQPEAEAIWAYLNSRDAKVAMRTAVYLRRPAIEAVIPGLREAAGEVLDKDLEHSRRFKMMTGRMVKEVMLNMGFEIDKSHVKIRADKMFTVATRYK